MAITYADDVRALDPSRVRALYRAVRWSCADELDDLCAALRGSHALVTAGDGDALVGLDPLLRARGVRARGAERGDVDLPGGGGDEE